MMARKSLLWSLVLGASAVGLLQGCASPALVRVHPWERGALADTAMDSNRDPLGSALADHVHLSREASGGGRSVGGAGCGCN
jgi:Domain of unknown function (DUF4266)